MYGRLGDSVRYRMSKGYAMIGEAPVCQSNYTWSAPPKCISKLFLYNIRNHFYDKLLCSRKYITFYNLICTPVYRTLQ